MPISYEEWEQKHGLDPQYWIKLSTVDPRGHLAVNMRDIPYGVKASISSPPTGLHACFDVGRSFQREGATEPSFICIRRHLCEVDCKPKTMTENHLKSYLMGALSTSDKIRLLQEAGINKYRVGSDR